MIVTINGATQSVKYWRAERLIAKGSGLGSAHVKMWSNIEGSETTPVAEYIPASGNVFIDLTDYVRANYGPISTIYLKVVGGATTTLGLLFPGLINPDKVLIPGYEPNTDTDELRVRPPYMFYKGSANVIAEIYLKQDYPTDIEAVGSATISSNYRFVTITGNNFELRGDYSYQFDFNYRAVPMQCGVRYALVRWVSFSGITRVHYFEVYKSKIETDNSYKLLPIDNEYIEIKGRADGFTLRLDNLDAYDYWYYADLLTSSKVEVSFDDGATFDRVEITNKNITIPDGERTDGKLEINVNWRRYDAVSM